MFKTALPKITYESIDEDYAKGVYGKTDVITNASNSAAYIMVSKSNI